MAMKLDIAKAFDKLEWNFIELMMKRLGFANQWCKWIMTCVTSNLYFILVNGSAEGKILPTRGIRLCDPICPYLYLICIEGLSSLIHNEVQAKVIHGFKASYNGRAISNMLFADDPLVFCQATNDECQNLLRVLNIYAKASGQYVNFQKSVITFGKEVSDQAKSNLTLVTGISKIGGLGRYLGLPEIL